MEIRLDVDDLTPLIQRIAAEVVAELSRTLPGDDRMAYSEPEAADMLGLRPHVLADERRRGRIGYARIVGGRIRYTRDHLTRYLAQRMEGRQ